MACFLERGRFRREASKSKAEKSEIRSFSSSGRFCGVENGFIGSSVKMMQKSSVTSSVALSRLENETVMPKRENLKKRSGVIW